MKDVLIRSIFGLLFLMVVFTPFAYDIQYGGNLMNLVFFTFSLLATHELFEMSSKSKNPSKFKLPALLLVTALFLPLLLQTAIPYFPHIQNPLWVLLIKTPFLFFAWGAIIAFIALTTYWIFKKDTIAFVFDKTLIF